MADLLTADDGRFPPGFFVLKSVKKNKKHTGN
ncbi:hypothetical protein N399_16750 [Bacillus licheniformis CG-B52]|nr:hypothetical protein N399_16750 [Bacillus licheniformis CG-B52]KUL10869.1 hypothetical protein LI17339_09355 [Bacillus licheniformis LMG 17339]